MKYFLTWYLIVVFSLVAIYTVVMGRMFYHILSTLPW
jgi:hypothetical protein